MPQKLNESVPAIPVKISSNAHLSIVKMTYPELFEKALPKTEKKKKNPQLTGRFTKEPMPKIPRNKPCPCGSGLKYKKCCGKPGRDEG